MAWIDDVMASLSLREYQLRAIDQTRDAVRNGHRWACVCFPTGGGKTRYALGVVAQAIAKGKRALFLSDRRLLVDQASKRAAEAGIPHGILMAGERRDTSKPFQIGSKDTILSRAVGENAKWELPPSDVVIVDECHRGTTGAWMELLQKYDKAIVIGLTATPITSKNTGLGKPYSSLIQTVSYSDLLSSKVLVPIRAFAPDLIDYDTAELKVGESGDFTEKSMERLLSRDSLVANAVTWWKKHAADRQTFGWCCSIRHSKAVMQEFQSAGIPCAHVDAQTPDSERAEILGKLADNKISLVFNVGVLTEGIDVPSVSAGIILRPTRSLVLYLQMVGRIVRSFHGKENAILLDHAGVVLHHGQPQHDMEWTLSDVDFAKKRQADMDDGAMPKPILCPRCQAIFSKSNVCPECGHVLRRVTHAKAQGAKAVGLREVTPGETVSVSDNLLKSRWFAALNAAANKKNGTVGVAAAIFKRMTGKFPTDVPSIKSMVDRVVTERADWKRPVTEAFPWIMKRRKKKE